MNANAQTIATVGQILSFIETNDATFAVLETSASNRGKWGGYVNLRLVRVEKGLTYRSPRSKGVKVLDHVESVYGRCRGPHSRYAQVVAEMTSDLEEAALEARLEAISAQQDAAIAPAQQWMCRDEVFFILDAAGSPAQAVA